MAGAKRMQEKNSNNCHPSGDCQPLVPFSLPVGPDRLILRSTSDAGVLMPGFRETKETSRRSIEAHELLVAMVAGFVSAEWANRRKGSPLAYRRRDSYLSEL